jgi:HPt (histidine-containing phosphotransfer) domain-containing protein
MTVEMESTPDRSASLYDRATVLDNLGGDVELLKEIAHIFLAAYRQELGRMRAALVAGDAATLYRLLHAMKGSMGNFGAQAGIDAAVTVERKARAGQLGGIDSDFAKLNGLIEQLADALRGEVGSG